jgi:hypothetical protein
LRRSSVGRLGNGWKVTEDILVFWLDSLRARGGDGGERVNLWLGIESCLLVPKELFILLPKDSGGEAGRLVASE